MFEFKQLIDSVNQTLQKYNDGTLSNRADQDDYDDDRSKEFQLNVSTGCHEKIITGTVQVIGDPKSESAVRLLITEDMTAYNIGYQGSQHLQTGDRATAKAVLGCLSQLIGYAKKAKNIKPTQISKDDILCFSCYIP